MLLVVICVRHFVKRLAYPVKYHKLRRKVYFLRPRYFPMAVHPQ